jgi:NAD(P)-dependent dehydrogenase (short-subunit alcohol dehydrogenase family)
VASEQTCGNVIVTGAAGGIGQALVKCFAEAGYGVIGTDKTDAPADFPGLHYIRAELQQSVADPEYASSIFEQIRACLAGQPLRALINNAAAQILGPADTLTRDTWRTTLDVNLLAPFFWAQALLPELEATQGMVLNISSIHARLTKPNFVAYATSKAALSGLTRAMAVELGARFAGDSDGYARLESHHPSGTIGNPDDLARFAVAVAATPSRFLNGAVLGFDGGIAGRLHDPV